MLNSTISSQTFSMPHLPSRYHYYHYYNHLRRQYLLKRSFEILGSPHKILKAIFKHSKSKVKLHNDVFFFFYDKFDILSTVPEGPEIMDSPKINSFVRRAVGERFMINSLSRISCAWWIQYCFVNKSRYRHKACV